MQPGQAERERTRHIALGGLGVAGGEAGGGLDLERHRPQARQGGQPAAVDLLRIHEGGDVQRCAGGERRSGQGGGVGGVECEAGVGGLPEREGGGLRQRPTCCEFRQRETEHQRPWFRRRERRRGVGRPAGRGERQRVLDHRIGTAGRLSGPHGARERGIAHRVGAGLRLALAAGDGVGDRLQARLNICGSGAGVAAAAELGEPLGKRRAALDRDQVDDGGRSRRRDHGRKRVDPSAPRPCRRGGGEPQQQRGCEFVTERGGVVGAVEQAERPAPGRQPAGPVGGPAAQRLGPGEVSLQPRCFYAVARQVARQVLAPAQPGVDARAGPPVGRQHFAPAVRPLQLPPGQPCCIRQPHRPAPVETHAAPLVPSRVRRLGRLTAGSQYMSWL